MAAASDRGVERDGSPPVSSPGLSADRAPSRPARSGAPIVRTRLLFGTVVVAALAAPLPAAAVSDGETPALVVSESVFGSARAIGNTLMEHDGTTNFALRVGGSQASLATADFPVDASVVRAFLFWSGSMDPLSGTDRDVDLRMPDGTFFNNLSVDAPVAGEPASTLNRCVERDDVGQTPVGFFSCRREVTTLLQRLGAGGASGTYTVSDVDALPGDSCPPDIYCQAMYAGWALVVMWESPTWPVRRDLVLYDAFYAVDEESDPFTSGVSPDFRLSDFLVGASGDGEITVLGFEGDAQLGVPPQNLYPPGNPLRCTTCDDFVSLRRAGGTAVRLTDVFNQPGNLFNGSNNSGGGPHPGLDIDTFEIGPSGLNVLRPDDTQVFLRVGSGDGQAGGGGGGGELVFLGMTLLALDTYSPRFSNNFTEKVVLEGVAGAGETLNYILRVGNDGSAEATQVVVKDQLPAGVSYVTSSTTNTCGVPSPDQGGTSPVLRPGGLNVGTLTIGERCEVRFKVTVNSGLANGTRLENFFTVESAELEPLTVGPAVTVVGAAEIGQPEKAVSVVGGGPPMQGSSLLYRIVVPNEGARAAPGVRVVDTLPAELQLDSFVSLPPGSTNSSNPATGLIDVSGISVPANGTAEITFLATIRPTTATGTVVENQADVTQPSLPGPLVTDNPATAAPRDPTRVTVQSGITLTSSSKSVTDVNGGQAVPGDVLEYRVRLVQSGPLTTTVLLADDMPPFVGGCAVVSLPPGAFGNCSPGGANGTGRLDAIVPVPGGATRDVVFRVTIASAAPDGTSIVNSAVLTPAEDASRAVTVTSPPISVFARPSFTTSTKAVQDLNGGDPRPGDELRYTVTVRNSGTIAATNVVVTDVVAATLTNIVAEDGGTLAGNTVTWNVGALAVGATATVRFRARIAAGVADGTVISNTARIAADAPAAPFVTPAVTVVVRASPTLLVQQRVTDLDGDGLFEPGDAVRYDIVLENTGDGAATDVVLRQPLDPSLTNARFAAGGRLVGNDVVFDKTTVATLASVPPGATVNLSFEADLKTPLDDGTVVSMQLGTTAPELPLPVVSDDPTTAAVNDPTRFVVESQAVLALAKTFTDVNGGAVMPGDDVEYVITVANTGNAAADDVVVRDTLDARLAFVSSSTGGALVGGDVVFTRVGTPALARVLPGAPVTLRFVVRVAFPLPNGTRIDNQGRGASPDAASVVSDDPTTAAPLDPTSFVVESRPVLDTFAKAVTDLDGDGLFEPGDRVRYDLVVENTGSEAATNVAVTDALPGALVNVAVLDGGALAGGVASWTLPSLAVGARVPLRVEADVRRPLANDTLVSNQATVAATGVAAVPSDDSATAAADDPTVFRVTSHPRLVVEKTVVDGNGAPPEPTDALRWTLRLFNAGGRAAVDVTVTDVVDANLVSVVPLDGGALAGNVITWSVANLAVDAEVELRFDSAIRSPLDNGTFIVNQASSNVAEAGVPGAPWLSDDPATPAPLDPTRVQVVSASDLTVSTLESFDESGAVIGVARPGDLVVYELVVKNAGREVAKNVVVTVPIPAALTVESAPGGTLAGGALRYTSAGVPGLAAVAPGVEVRIAFEARLAFPLDDGTLVDVQAQLDEDGLVAPVPSDDPSTAPLGDVTRVVVESAPDLSRFEKRFEDASGAPVEPGEEIRYLLVVENSGDMTARDVVVSDPLPAEVTFVSSADGGRVVSGSVVFDSASTPALAALDPGQRELSFVVRVADTVTSGTIVSNQARVAASGVASVLSDDPATAAIDDPTRFEVRAVPRVALDKGLLTATGTRRVAPDEPLRYTFVVRSTGSAPTGALLLEDVLPAVLVDVVAGPGLAFDATTRTLTASLASLAAGEQLTLGFTARVASDAANGAFVQNQARVSGDDVEAALSDDPDTAAALDPTLAIVEAFPELTASTKEAIDVDGAPLMPGDQLRYTIVVRNGGNGAARDVVLTDALDTARLEVVSVSDGGRQVGSDVIWDGTTTPALASLAPGASLALTLDVRVRAGVADGTAIANQGSLTARDVAGAVLTDDPATAALDDATVVIVRAPLLTFEKRIVDESDGPPLRPGDRVRYQLTVQNAGSAAATGVVVTDVPSEALTEVVPLDGGVMSGGLLSWAAPAVPALASLEPGASVTVALEARVEPLTLGGTVVVNQAELAANELATPLLSDDPTTAAAADATRAIVEADEDYAGTVELFDAESGAPIVAPVVPEQRVRARVTFRNEGTQTGRGGVLRVPFNPLRFVLEEATEFGIIDQDADEARWDTSLNEAFRDLTPEETLTVEVTGRVVSPIPDGATIEVRGELTTLSDDETFVFGPAMMTVTSKPALGESTKEVVDENGGLVEPGDVLSYRITVVNRGGTQAADVIVVDPVPAGTRYLPGSTTLAGAAVADAALGSPLAQGLAIGDLGAGRSLVVTFRVRVDIHALRGFVIANQAVLRTPGVPDAVTDNPRTPLVDGDATVVVVGGGATLVVHKRGAPSPVEAGGVVRFEIAVENAGNDVAQELVLRDPLGAGAEYVEESVTVDGAAQTDAADADDVTVGAAPGSVIEVRRHALEAGEGFVVAFRARAAAGATQVRNQAEVLAPGQPLLLSDGEPEVPGAQATVIPVVGSDAVLVDEGTTVLSDGNGGVLEAGDPLVGRTVVKNRAGFPLSLAALRINVSALFDVDTGALDPRLAFDAGSRTLRLAAGTAPALEPGGALSFDFYGNVNANAQDAERVTALAEADVRRQGGGDPVTVDLGSASLTVGLLAGTGALIGSVFFEGEDRDGALDGESDVRAIGFSVMAYPLGSSDDDPVRTAISDERGGFRLAPLPAGDWRVEVRSPSGAVFAEHRIEALGDGEVRERDLLIDPSGAVYSSATFETVRGARAWLYFDDGDGDIENDERVPEESVRPGQQGQLTTLQGLYRFDAPPGDYRLGLEPPDALTVFPSTRIAPMHEASGHPLGDVADVDSSGRVVAHALPDEALDRSYFLRFHLTADGPPVLNNHVPVDRLQDRVRITKTANRRRLTVGDLVAYTVRVENRSATAVSLDDGGVEIVDTLPEAFRLVDESWRLDRLETDAAGQQRRFAEPTATADGHRIVRFGAFPFAPGATYELRYQVVVGPGAPRGDVENRAVLRLAAGQVPISDVATARVRVEADPLFDLGSLRAKVFCDDDGDGWQDAGERGVAGARVYLDTGHFAESDITGKLHFTLVPPGMHLAKLDVATLPPGTTMVGDERRSFYLSGGLPAQASFGARCAFERVLDPEIIVNADAYRPPAAVVVEPRRVKVEALLTMPRVVLDGVEMAVPAVDLGVGAAGAEPSFGRAPGPNLPRLRQGGVLEQGLGFFPKVDAARRVVGWQLTVEREGDESRAVYVFEGDGAPPGRIDWDGRDSASGALLLEEGARYSAVLAVVVEGGDEGMSAARPFGVAFGEPESGSVVEPFEVKLDAAEGPLFNAAGAPTRRLNGWLRSHAPRLVANAGEVHVFAHVDARPKEATQARTAQQAAAIAKILEELGVAKERIRSVGEGDQKPVRPNLRERDRRQNRRVELRLVVEAPRYAPLEPRSWPGAVRVGDEVVVVPDGAGAIEHTAVARIGDLLVVDVTAPSGGRARVMRRVPEGAFDATGASGALESAPAMRVAGDLASGTLRFGERELALDVGAVDVGADATTADGALRVAVGDDGKVRAVFVPKVPAEREWARWRLRVMGRRAGAADAAQEPSPDGGVTGGADGGVVEGGGAADDEGSRSVVRELAGDGAPPERVEWDGTDAAGALAAAAGDQLYVRLIVETRAGDVLVSPDVLAIVEQGAAPPMGAGVPIERTAIDDALGKDGKLKKPAQGRLRELGGRLLPTTGAIRVEVHTDDDDGPRFTRRARTQAAAEAARALLVEAGVDAARVTALGMGSDNPKVPNLNERARKQNRRVEVELTAPPAPVAVQRRFMGSARVVANGRELPVEGGRFDGEVPATRSGEVALMVRTDEGARALLKLRPEGGEVWQGTPEAFALRVAAGAPPVEPVEERDEGDGGPAGDGGLDDGGLDDGGTHDAGPSDDDEALALAPYPDAAKEPPPAWWPRRADVAAATLEVELPPEGEPFRTDKLVVRGKTDPRNRVRVGDQDVAVDPATGEFEHMVALHDGDGELVVEATDPVGNRARVRRQVSVDQDGWFILALADTAFGQDAALLDERTPYTSLKLGDVFVYGRGVAYVKGRVTGGFLFKDYDLTLHLDTSRWEEEAWARDLLNPDLVYPLYGDSSLEVQDASARFPIYLQLKADHSSFTVGNVRPVLAGGDLFRYQRARYGASLVFDRGWTTTPLDVSDIQGSVVAPAADPWRTRVGGFFTGGDTRERHARAELMGTGGAVYFLRHELVVEGSERVAVIVRDGTTGAEIARRPLARNIDYTMRYAEGRVFLAEPLPAFTDASFTVNHNLGQVSAGHRVFLEVEYDHEDAEPFAGLAGGAHASQTLFGHLELGGGYVYEGREDGRPGYQLGGVDARLFWDDVTWLKAEWAWSQNVDAGNFLSLDGGLTYQPMGLSLDAEPHRFGRVVFPAEREGHAYKLEGQLGFAQLFGRPARDGLLHAYFQRQSPGFFAGAAIVEQGQTKWGGDGMWRITDDDTVRLRYDGVIAEVPEIPQLASETRTLHRQIATAQYQRRILKSLSGAVEYGYGYTADSGSFGDSATAEPRDYHTNVAALALDWQALERLSLGVKQEGILTGDPNQLLAWNDHLITHGTVRYHLTEDLALTATESVRWNGENQTSAGVAWRVNDEARVYANERFGFARGGFTNTTVVGGETLLGDGGSSTGSSTTRAYAEYQLQSAFSSDQTRGIVGVSNRWKLPFGFALSLGYERVQTVGGIVPTTDAGNVPPGAFTDGTFYAAPGANGGGNWFYGAGSRDAASAGIEWVRPGLFIGSQRFEIRYDNFDEDRGGHDRVWLLNMSNAELRFTPEVSLLARFNIGLAQDLTLAKREAYLEESMVGVAYRPVTHDWVSVLAKLSRKVDSRPLSLSGGTFEDYTIHAAAIEPIVELPWKIQLVEKLAVKHVSQVLDDLPRADAWTLLWINRLNWHALGTIRSFGVDPFIPGEIDLGVEYRVLAGITAARLEHGALVEVQYAPIEYFRIGVGYNFTHFSDSELARDDRDYSGFFVRGVGQY